MQIEENLNRYFDLVFMDTNVSVGMKGCHVEICTRSDLLLSLQLRLLLRGKPKTISWIRESDSHVSPFWLVSGD